MKFHNERELYLIKFQDVNRTAKVGLLENNALAKWKAENVMLSKIEMTIERALLSALEINIGNRLVASKIVDSKDGFLIEIDIFMTVKFKEDFVASLVFNMLPRLPEVRQIVCNQ